ncbi:MAG: HAD family hydrolase [bacterium]
MRKNFDLIIFDLDGTLIDTMGSFADIAGELIEKHCGWNFEIGRKRYLETSGIPFFQQMEILFPGGDNNEVIVQRFEKLKIAAFVHEKVSEKTLETLHELKECGFRTVISSNNFHDLVREFVHRENVPVDLALGFRPHFSKGCPHFDYIAEYFKVPRNKMLFVGDSLRDAEIAHKNAIQFIAKVGTFNPEDFKLECNSEYLPVIYEIYEILEILEDL